MKYPIRISDQLDLPLGALKDLVAIVARRGRGKTYAGSVMAEELLKAGQQIAVLDPMDVWWGLRSSADGKGEGFPVVIFGGDHADVDLTPAMGREVADFLVTENISVIIVPEFETNQETVEFMTAFLDRLLKSNREPLHLFFDEAEAFAPERPAKYEQRMLGAMGRLVKRGRVRGLFPTLITQRTASINKNTISQAAGLFSMALSSPWDRAPVERWMASNGTPEQMALVKEDLAALPVGEGWFWHPDQDIFQRIKIRKRETFDSSATPDSGTKRATPATWSEIDITKVADRMKAAVERAKADDPVELKKEVASLKRQLQATPKEAKSLEIPVEVEVIQKVEVPTLRKDEIDRLERIAMTISEAAGQMASAAAAIAEQLKTTTARQDQVMAKLDEATRNGTRARTSAPIKSARVSQTPRSRPQSRPTARDTQTDTDGSLTSPQRRVLDSIAWWESVGIDVPTKVQVGFIAGYRVTKKVGGTYGNILGSLKSAGLIDYPMQGHVSLTDDGRAEAQSIDLPPTEEDLQAAFMARLQEPERRVLGVAIEVYPEAIDKVELGQRSGYSVTEKVGGTFGNILGRLRSLALIDYPQKGFVVALPVLFLEGS